VPGGGDEDLRVDPAGGGTVEDRLVAKPFQSDRSCRTDWTSQKTLRNSSSDP